jgi:hypothetical protein
MLELPVSPPFEPADVFSDSALLDTYKRACPAQ